MQSCVWETLSYIQFIRLLMLSTNIWLPLMQLLPSDQHTLIPLKGRLGRSLGVGGTATVWVGPLAILLCESICFISHSFMRHMFSTSYEYHTLSTSLLYNVCPLWSMRIKTWANSWLTVVYLGSMKHTIDYIAHHAKAHKQALAMCLTVIFTCHHSLFLLSYLSGSLLSLSFLFTFCP